jgi:hypothetical protein
MEYSDDFLLGAHAHSEGVVKTIDLVSGDLPIQQYSSVWVQLIRDDDRNCVMGGVKRLVHSLFV